MQKITKQEVNNLISNNIIRLNKQGNYNDPTGDNKIVVTGEFGSKTKKQRYIQDTIINRLFIEKLKKFVTKDRLEEILKLNQFEQNKILQVFESKDFDISKVKDNQRYLFIDMNSSVS